MAGYPCSQHSHSSANFGRKAFLKICWVYQFEKPEFFVEKHPTRTLKDLGSWWKHKKTSKHQLWSDPRRQQNTFPGTDHEKPVIRGQFTTPIRLLWQSWAFCRHRLRQEYVCCYQLCDWKVMRRLDSDISFIEVNISWVRKYYLLWRVNRGHFYRFQEASCIARNI